jgi:chorismate synthase
VPGQSAIVTQRKETDTVRILSGVFEGQTLGTPISLEMSNLDMRPGDYREVMEKFRPSHADYTYEAKYGFRDWRGGGRTSARETAGRVAAGAIARKLLTARWNLTVVAWVSKVGDARRRVRSRARHARRGRSHADPLPRSGAGRAHDRGRRGGAQGRRLARRHRSRARARLPAGWGEPVFDASRPTWQGGA